MSKYWSNLINRVDAVCDPPADRPHNGRRSGYLSAQVLKHFDNGAFDIGLSESEVMDPQQRLLLHVAREAFADAGIVLEEMNDRSVGVFVGISAVDYTSLSQRAVEEEQVCLSETRR